MAIIISASGSAVVESSANVIEYTITLSEPAIDAVTVKFRTLLAGTANESDIYYRSFSASNNGTITFLPGETTATVNIYTASNTVDTVDRHVVLELYDPSEGTFVDETPVLRTSGVILDDDGPGSNLAVFVSDPVLVEGDGTKFVNFEVRLSQPAPSAFSFNYATINGTAVAGSDYVATSGMLNFVPGQSVATVSVQVLGDAVSEITEQFFLSVKPQAGAPTIDLTGAVGNATILDDDTGTGAVISLSNGSAVTESSSNAVRFVVTLSEPAIDAVTVNYRTLLAGTAIDDDLYYPITSANYNGTVTFAPGETSKDFIIYTASDTLDERDEHFIVELYHPNGASFAGNEITIRKSGVILDDDGAGSNLSLFVSDPVVLEGAGGTRDAVFEIRLSRPAPQDFVATYSTISGSALAGTDFQAVSGNITFVAGQDIAYVRVPVIGDAVAEPTEYFSLKVTPPGTISIGTDGSVGTATILDDDGSATLPVISVTGGEGGNESSSDTIRFVLTLSKPSIEPVTVLVSTELGTAAASDLYYSLSNANNTRIVNFAPGQTTTTVDIYMASDTIDERDESIRLVLTNPTNAVLAGGVSSVRRTGFILDNDGAGLNITLAATPQVVTEPALGTQQIEVLVQLSRPADGAITFNVTSTNQTAVSGSDFQLVDTSVTFQSGQTTAAVRVNILSDKISETLETFALNFQLASGNYPIDVIPSVIVTINPGPIYGTNNSETINGGVYADTIYGLNGNDTINGLGGNDTLVGGEGNDTLDGGAGADKLYGGGGNDTYVLGAENDLVSDNGGTADVITSTITRSLATYSGIEQLRLLGTANINGTGNSLNNIIYGNSGNNVLDGGAGQDTLAGGLGNDTYVLANSTDTVTDSGGIDTITSTISRSLTSYTGIENLTLVGTANANATGDANANTLVGNAGNNVLKGGSGADKLYGGAGNDIYDVGGDKSDTISDSSGIDTINTGVTWSLVAYTDIERLFLTGTANINGTGNNLNNNIIGNVGNNVLSGGIGNDSIQGNAGADTLTGGAGADYFVYLKATDSTTAQRDTITDFKDSGADKIKLTDVYGPTLAYLGTAAFSGIGQVRVQQSGADVIVSVNLDANLSTSEMQIRLAGTTLAMISAGDFVL